MPLMDWAEPGHGTFHRLEPPLCYQNKVMALTKLFFAFAMLYSVMKHTQEAVTA